MKDILENETSVRQKLEARLLDVDNVLRKKELPFVFGDYWLA